MNFRQIGQFVINRNINTNPSFSQYNFGTFLIAINGIIFGFLEYIQDTALFLGLSYFLRYNILQQFNLPLKIFLVGDSIFTIYRNIFDVFYRCFGGVYETAAWNSVTSILMALYPDKVASVMSWTQMFFGFGYMIGSILIPIRV